MASTASKDEVKQQLKRIVASEEFTGGLRVRKFLEHIVSEELDDRGELLKGTALAMDIFGRGVDFDPGSDPIVRTEAIKLRKALEHYYLTAGTEDRILISVPKGTYRPEIRLREVTRSAGPVSQSLELPVLSIYPFTGANSELGHLYRDGLPSEIALELARFDHIRVRTEIDAPTETAHAPSAGYELSGQVQEASGTLRIVLQLTRNPTNEIVWSERYRVDPKTVDVFELQEEIARNCATSMADAYGALTEDANARFAGRRKEDAGVFEALLAFHAHMRTSRIESLREFSELARMALQDNPDSGLAHALVAMSAVEAVILDQGRLSDLVARVRIHAEQAVALAPNCQEALFAAAVMSLLQGDRQRFDVLCNQAIRSNPNGALLTAMVGGWVAMIGELDRGASMVEHALSRNPMLPVWTRATLALVEIGRGEFEKASSLVCDLNVRDVTGEWIILAAAHGLAGQKVEALKASKRLSDLGVDVEAYVASLPIEPEIGKRLVEGVRLASSFGS